MYEKVKAHPYYLQIVSTSTFQKIVANIDECCFVVHLCIKFSKRNI